MKANLKKVVGTSASLKKPNRFVFYGTGKHAAGAAPHTLRNGLNFIAFVDTNKRGTMEFDLFGTIHSFPIIGLEAEYNDCLIIIAVRNVEATMGIRKKLAELNIPDERIMSYDEYRCLREFVKMSFSKELLDKYALAVDRYFPDEISREVALHAALLRSGYIHIYPTVDEDIDRQYFDKSVENYRCHDEEVFVDAGFFMGRNFELFTKEVAGHYRKYYGFELSKYNIDLGMPHLQHDDRLEIICAGVSDKEEVIHTDLSRFVLTTVNFPGTDRAQLLTLDGFFENHPIKPTTIIADIEGSEVAMVRGAKTILQKNKPKLAICAYHKPDDIYELPRLIKEINPDYSFALGHFTSFLYETVLYAFLGVLHYR